MKSLFQSIALNVVGGGTKRLVDARSDQSCSGDDHRTDESDDETILEVRYARLVLKKVLQHDAHPLAMSSRGLRAVVAEVTSLSLGRPQTEISTNIPSTNGRDTEFRGGSPLAADSSIMEDPRRGLGEEHEGDPWTQSGISNTTSDVRPGGVSLEWSGATIRSSGRRRFE